MSHRLAARMVASGLLAMLCWTSLALARTWSENAFESRPLLDYPMPAGRDSVVGAFTAYTIDHGDTLLDIGRWYGLSGTEISDANNHIDWWAPPAGREIVLPTEHILPEGPRTGIVMNIPEMRIYYYYPTAVAVRRHRRLRRAVYAPASPRVVYTFPVGLGRFDWKTPIGGWTVTGKLVNPTWVVPEDIYEEHLERDGEAEHVVPGGDPDNPLGHYKLVLSLPEYGIHGTDVPWGVGMNVSHGCIRLYPEDIERLYMRTPVGTPGRFVYQPIKFGWRGNALYVEVHDDLYAVYPGLWNHAVQEVHRLHLEDDVDMVKLEKAVEAKTGLVTYVMPGAAPGSGGDTASATTLPPVATMVPPLATTLPPPEARPASAAVTEAVETPGNPSVDAAPSADAMTATGAGEPETSPAAHDDESSPSTDGDWEPLPARVTGGDSVE